MLYLKRLVVAIMIACSTLAATGCGERKPATGTEGGREIIVAAASDLVPAFEELGRMFEQEEGMKVVFSFSSTGNLAKQIENGAPVDLLAAANISFIEDLESKGLIVAGTKQIYARGRITIWTRADSPLRVERIEDLARPEFARIAIANPAHAPYGLAAREALQSAGIWNTVEPRLVMGENVRQTLQYCETGNVEAAIVALSLSVSSNGRWVLVPETLHRPLDQAMAIIRASQKEGDARRFAAFIGSERGRAVMRRYGFVLPGEEPGS